MERYQDFVIRISAAEQGTFRVHAASLLGEASTTFTIPFDEKDLKIFMLEVGRPRSASSRGRIPDFMRPTVDFGHSLYNAVIHNDVRDLFVRSLHNADQQNEGLRIRLRLNEAPGLAHLPWEFLYDGRDFLALSDASPLVRYLDLPNPPRRLAVDLPLRILVTISAPSDLPTLDVGLEKSKIEQALSRLVSDGMVKLDYTQNASLNTLQRALRRAKSAGEPYHVWHYIGHGYFDPDQQTSMLALTNEQGMLQMVSGFELGTLLQNFNELRLALLNACEGARSGNEDPFAGVSTALVEYGIPAVIAMQFEISDQAAITFASEFYAALVDGLGLDTAVTNARRTVFFMPNYVEWATPVLYLRSPESRIFDFVKPGARFTPAAPDMDTQARRDEEQRLLSLYVRGLSDFYLERWESAVHHLQAVVAGQADYEDAAEKLAEARYKLELTTLYQKSQSSIQAGAWEEAIASLQKLLAKEPGYLDASALLAEVQRNKQLGDLYEQAGLLFQASQWQAVLTVFERLDEVDPQFLDTKNLRQQARENHVREERARKLEELYAQALLRIKESDLPAAQQVLEEALAIDPEYEDTSALLEKVREERQIKEREQKLEHLYTGARQAIQKGDFATAQDSLEQLLVISPEYKDAPALLEKVKVDRALKEKEHKLQGLKTQALRSLNAREFDAAQEALEQILSLDPQYEDAQALLEKVNSERARQEKLRLESQQDTSQTRQLADLYKQALAAVWRKDWQGAQSLLEQVQAVQPDYKDTQDLLAKVTRELRVRVVTPVWKSVEDTKGQPDLEKLQARPNILKGPVPLLAWVGLHVVVWFVHYWSSRLYPIFEIQGFIVQAFLLAGVQWFLLRKILPGRAVWWSLLTASGVVLGRVVQPALINDFFHQIFWDLLFEGTIGFSIMVFSALAGLVQARFLPVDSRKRWIWVASSLIPGLAWFIFFERARFYGLGYILLGIFHGGGTGLVLNWLLRGGAAGTAQAAGAPAASSDPLTRFMENFLEKESWRAPVPMTWWVGLHLLGWIVFSFINFDMDWQFLLACGGFILILAAGQWILLRKLLPKGAVRWGIIMGLEIVLGLGVSIAVFLDNWMPPLTAALFIGGVLAVTGGLGGFLQSRLLPVDRKERVLWIIASLFLGIAAFLFFSGNMEFVIDDYYKEQVFFSALVVGAIHGAVSGVTLNSILSRRVSSDD